MEYGIMPVADRLQTASYDLRQHFEEEWEYASSSNGRSHTSRCPYCIAVAKEVERTLPSSVLDPVPNRTPNCFVINGSQFAASGWGTLHSVQNGRTGPAVGTIWFSNGQYFGRGYDGSIVTAQPNC